MAVKKKPSIPLKDMMRAIDTNDFDFYASLDKEQRKAFSPWMAMRYTSSAQGTAAFHYLLMVNDLVNVEFTTLKNHPELQWKLLAVCGIGTPTFHPWIPPGKKKKKSKVQDFLWKIYPNLSRKEIELLMQINTKEDIKNLARDCGLDDKEIKDILK